MKEQSQRMSHYLATVYTVTQHCQLFVNAFVWLRAFSPQLFKMRKNFQENKLFTTFPVQVGSSVYFLNESFWVSREWINGPLTIHAPWKRWEINSVPLERCFKHGWSDYLVVKREISQRNWLNLFCLVQSPDLDRKATTTPNVIGIVKGNFEAEYKWFSEYRLLNNFSSWKNTRNIQAWKAARVNARVAHLNE